ncbi:EAL domain-containing protein [Saccharospirillum impatiens]|uniref:EAL domain-containing protein n=1 Tax=Saccharospirillum impatiens TaxID=169438 RepID=UPI0004173DD8|nr:EAL domain-containing protein [Saccharospirillum impatiens]
MPKHSTINVTQSVRKRFLELKFITRIALVFGALGLITLFFSMLYAVKTAQNSLDSEIQNALRQHHRTAANLYANRLDLLDAYLQSAAANQVFTSIASGTTGLDSAIDDIAYMFQDSALGNNIDVLFITDASGQLLFDASLPLYDIDPMMQTLRSPVYYTQRWLIEHTTTLTVVLKAAPLFDPASLRLRGYLYIGLAIGQNRALVSDIASQSGVDVIKVGLGDQELIRQTELEYKGAASYAKPFDRVVLKDNVYSKTLPLNIASNRDDAWIELGLSANNFPPVAETYKQTFFVLSAGFILLFTLATWLVHLNHNRSISNLLQYIANTRQGTRAAPFETGGIYEHNQVGLAMQSMVYELNIAANVFESAQGMLVTDGATRILKVNKAFTRMTGYHQEDIAGELMNLVETDLHDESINQIIEDSLAINGSWQGEAWGRRKNGEYYLQWMHITAVLSDEGDVVQNFVVTIIDTTERKAAEQRIEQLAFYDQLTSLPNRRMLIDRLNKALIVATSSQQYGALLYIDLDDFKTLNDTRGHHTGDLFLQQVAERLGSRIRHTDTVARIGGDEFIILLENLSGSEAEARQFAEALAASVLDAFRQPFIMPNLEHFSTLSIGMTLFSNHSHNVDELLKQADLAMYQAKDAGKNTARFFTPDMQARVSEHLQMANEIRTAIKDKQFELFLQPQVDSDHLVIGAESLLRWHHPSKGLVTPAEIIKVAEDTGLINPLGHWVIERSCEILAGWANDSVLSGLTMSVNISARQLHQHDFVADVVRIVQHTGVPAAQLKLELTESMLLENIQDTIAKMHQLRLHGIGFSLDDFGTGYSSLSYLKQLPLDQLKIDQSFVNDLTINPDDSDIAKTIISLASSMSINAIAEGVETAEQAMLLKQFGCQAFQGYYFGYPVPLANFEQSVRAACQPG